MLLISNPGSLRKVFKYFSFVDPGVLYKDRAINKMDGESEELRGAFKGQWIVS